MITSDVSSFEKFKQALSHALENMPKQSEAYVIQEAEEVMDDSRRNYVPVDFGSLKESGEVRLERNDDGVIVKLIYDEPYALVVHEDLEARHRAGQAKYLEVPFFKKTKDLEERLAEHLAEEAE